MTRISLLGLLLICFGSLGAVSSEESAPAARMQDADSRSERTDSAVRAPADSEEAADKGATVVRLQVENAPVTPVVARYIERGIEEAVAASAHAVVVELDTPGGLMESTQQIVRTVVQSPVPVIVFVYPSGGRAASAGLFITLSAHVAAMAPGTHIGAAHPVSIGGGAPGSPGGNPPDTTTAPTDTTTRPSPARPQSVMGEKVLNDAVAWARSLAEMRGRNADWSAEAVTESSSITGTRAAEIGVVDLEVPNLNVLLRTVDGREVITVRDTVELRTAGATIQDVSMWWGERLLGAISNPNVAFLLLMFGFYGLLFEFYTGGWGVGGTVGAICLVLAGFGLSVLPVNYAGLALLVLGLGLLVAEAFVTSFGALTVGGGLCILFGGLMLVDAPIEGLQVSISVVLPVAIATAAIAFFLVGSALRAHREPVRTGTSGMVGSRAVPVDAFEARGDGYRGMVRAHGELWQAHATEPVGSEDALRIVARDGLTLEVEPAASDGSSSSSSHTESSSS